MSARVLDPAEIASRAQAALSGSFDAPSVTDVEQFVGGSSSLTYSAHLTTGDERRRIVVKVAPPGLEPVRNRDVLRQARILQLLGDVPEVAVPEVLATDPGEPVDVPPLFVMSFVPGESYEPKLAPARSTATKREIEARAYAAARMGAALHAVPTDDPRLEGERLTDLEAEVGRWTRAFGSVDDDLRPGADGVQAKLLASIPASGAPSVLHGDWRLGNMQCNGSAIDGVIDWEIWSLGDPRLDLAWFLLLIDPAHPNKTQDDTGLPTPEELTAAYGEASGRPIADLDWFAALVRYKQAAASALIIKNNRKIQQPGVDIDRMFVALPKLLAWADDLLS